MPGPSIRVLVVTSLVDVTEVESSRCGPDRSVGVGVFFLNRARFRRVIGLAELGQRGDHLASVRINAVGGIELSGTFGNYS